VCDHRAPGERRCINQKEILAMTVPGPDIKVPRELDPFLLEHLDDPYPIYEQLRDLGPIVHLPDRDIWLAVRHASVSAVLRDHRHFVSGLGSSARRVAEAGFRAPFIDNDPPDHTRIRHAVQRRFHRPEVEKLRPAIHEATVQLVDAAVEQGDVDVVPALTQPLPQLAIQQLTGITPPDTGTMTSWADSTMHISGPDVDPVHTTRVMDAVLWLGSTGVAQMPEHCLGHLIMEHGGDTGGLTGEERLLTLGSIWTAGIDSTNSLLANAMYAFATFPQAWNTIRTDPSLIPHAVEEILRWESPFRQFFRRTLEEVEFEGARIPADADVCVIFPSANRDPERFKNPDLLDVRRGNARQHVAFGASVHFCLGAPVARLEAAELLTVLSSRVARFELLGRPTRNPNRQVRNFTSLPMRLVRS
jgi:cytochrome P450